MAERALRTDDEVKAVPLTEPVLIDLGKIQGDDRKKAEGDSGLDRSNNKELAEARAEASRLQRERDEAIAYANKAINERDQFEGTFQQSKLTTATSELSAAQADMKSAKAELVSAFDKQDTDAIANAQEKIGRCAGRILNAEAVVAEMDSEVKANKGQNGQQQQERREQAPQKLTKAQVLNNIDANDQLTSKEKQWLKERPELILDPSQNEELAVAHRKAVRGGLERGTSEYFNFIDDQLGYKRTEFRDDVDNGDVAAPPSRTGGNGSNSDMRVRLTPDQRAMAASMGVTELEYAQQILRLNQDKKANPERYYTGGR